MHKSPFDDAFEQVFSSSTDENIVHKIPEDKSLKVAMDFTARLALGLIPAFIPLFALVIALENLSDIKFIVAAMFVFLIYTLFIKREMFKIVRFRVGANFVEQFIAPDAPTILKSAAAYNQRRGKISNIVIQIVDPASQVKISKSRITVFKHNHKPIWDSKIIIPAETEGFEDIKVRLLG